MSEYLWPPDIVPSAQDWRVLGNVASFESPFTGSIRTVSRSGGRLGCRLVVPPLKGTDRYRLMSILAALRDRSNYLLVPDFSTTRRGSFPASELFTNNDFANGTTGWSGQYATLSVADRVMRVKATGATMPQNFAVYQAPTVTQYAPTVLRSVIRATQNPLARNGIFDGQEGSNYADNGAGYFEKLCVPRTTTLSSQYPGVWDGGPGTYHVAGDYGEVLWCSQSRCISADAGANSITYSDQFDNAAWTATAATVTANASTAPDGTTTADGLTESVANTQHYINPTSTVVTASATADYAVSVMVKQGSGDRDIRLAVGNTGAGNYGDCVFDLSAGTAGTPSNGGTVTNTRAFIVSKGNGWFECHVVALIPTGTAITPLLQMYNAGASTYAGSGGSLYLWRAVLAQSSLPTRGALTTSAATSGASQTSSAIYVKGLPASTNGLLLAGDVVSCGGQGNIVTASLDADGAGRGVLQCANPWRAGLADNAPIIVHQPLVKMRPAGDIAWPTGPGQFSSFEIDLVEDIT